MITEADIKTIREQGDLKDLFTHAIETTRQQCAARLALVRRHPDLWDRIQQIPGQRMWTGYLAPAVDVFGRPEHSLYRARLAAIVAEAEQRDTTAYRGQAGAWPGAA